MKIQKKIIDLKLIEFVFFIINLFLIFIQQGHVNLIKNNNIKKKQSLLTPNLWTVVYACI